MNQKDEKFTFLLWGIWSNITVVSFIIQLKLDRREPDDPCSYLLAIWTPGRCTSRTLKISKPWTEDLAKRR